MEANEYQALAMRTSNKALSNREHLINGALGLCGESGEVADIIKKHTMQGHPLNREHIAQVSGDAQVYGDAQVSGDALNEKATHYLLIGAIGSRDDTTTFFRTKDKQIFVKCGCFTGGIDEFVDAVKSTHGGTKHEKTYMLAVELAKAQIEDVENGGADDGK